MSEVTLKSTFGKFAVSPYNKPENIQNPFSGEVINLSGLEAAVYDYMKGAELMGLYDDMNKARDWFMTNNTKAYMALVD